MREPGQFGTTSCWPCDTIAIVFKNGPWARKSLRQDSRDARPLLNKPLPYRQYQANPQSELNLTAVRLRSPPLPLIDLQKADRHVANLLTV